MQVKGKFSMELNIFGPKVGFPKKKVRTQRQAAGSDSSISDAGDVFHGISKEDHRHGVPAAPRSSPTGLAPLPALAPAALSPASTPHLANIAAVSFPKTGSSPGFVESLKSFCPAPMAPPPPTTDGSVSAPPSVCR